MVGVWNDQLPPHDELFSTIARASFDYLSKIETITTAHLRDFYALLVGVIQTFIHEARVLQGPGDARAATVF